VKEIRDKIGKPTENFAFNTEEKFQEDLGYLFKLASERIYER
jgi:hypothetical protein